MGAASAIDSNMGSSSSAGGDMYFLFRQKATFMKTWKPASNPSVSVVVTFFMEGKENWHSLV
jgi:hypothetical protein